ncbi:MAG: CRISPR-associated endonuclease Cas2 [Bacteroidetes bacterium]|nr:CRISPR-associated endonuclease Cas2 [Bacteroidota bacterium]
MFVILMYDVGEARVGKALKICRKYLQWVQNSCFEGELTEGQLRELKIKLVDRLNPEEDSLIFYTLPSNKKVNRIDWGVGSPSSEEQFY